MNLPPGIGIMRCCFHPRSAKQSDHSTWIIWVNFHFRTSALILTCKEIIWLIAAVNISDVYWIIHIVRPTVNSRKSGILFIHFCFAPHILCKRSLHVYKHPYTLRKIAHSIYCISSSQ